MARGRQPHCSVKTGVCQVKCCSLLFDWCVCYCPPLHCLVLERWGIASSWPQEQVRQLKWVMLQNCHSSAEGSLWQTQRLQQIWGHTESAPGASPRAMARSRGPEIAWAIIFITFLSKVGCHRSCALEIMAVFFDSIERV